MPTPLRQLFGAKPRKRKLSPARIAALHDDSWSLLASLLFRPEEWVTNISICQPCALGGAARGIYWRLLQSLYRAGLLEKEGSLHLSQPPRFRPSPAAATAYAASNHAQAQLLWERPEPQQREPEGELLFVQPGKRSRRSGLAERAA